MAGIADILLLMNRFWIWREWIRARTVSAPGRDAGRDSVLLLTHIDGQTGLNIPENT